MNHQIRLIATKSNAYSIIEHLVDSSHNVNKTNAFSTFYEAPKRLRKIDQERIKATTEAIAIHLQRPTLGQHLN